MSRSFFGFSEIFLYKVEIMKYDFIKEVILWLISVQTSAKSGKKKN